MFLKVVQVHPQQGKAKKRVRARKRGVWERPWMLSRGSAFLGFYQFFSTGLLCSPGSAWKLCDPPASASQIVGRLQTWTNEWPQPHWPQRQPPTCWLCMSVLHPLDCSFKTALLTIQYDSFEVHNILVHLQPGAINHLYHWRQNIWYPENKPRTTDNWWFCFCIVVYIF